jgi:hypothetical protein
MYQEAKMLMELNVTRKQLPEFGNIDIVGAKEFISKERMIKQYPLTPKECFDPTKVKEDW